MKNKVLIQTLKYMLQHKFLLLCLTISSLILTFIVVYTPTFTAKILDDVLAVDGSQQMNEVIKLLSLFFLFTILIFIFRYLQTFFLTKLELKIEKNVRMDAIKKISLLPVDYFSLEPDGKIVSKITSDSNGVRQLFSVSVNLIQALLNIISVYIALLIVNISLGIVMFFLVPIIILWITFYRKRIYTASRKIREISSRITGKLNELITGAPIIQAYNQESAMTNEYSKLVYNYNDNNKKVTTISIFFGWELISFLRRIAQAVVIAFFGFTLLHLISNGQSTAAITAGSVYLFVTYIDRMVLPINQIFENLNAFEDGIIGATRVMNFINEENDEKELKPDFPKINTGKVEFKNVDFSYIEGKKVLNNFSLTVEDGQTIGIVGHTGSGKSTLMNLLLRYNDYDSGTIKLDGNEIDKYNKTSYRKNLGIVLQNPSIFKGTLKSNITLERDYSDNEVVEVLKLVGAEFLIKKSSLGINQEINFKGENLSLGEKQLISFARVLLRNPKILVLDEATANIDTHTETMIKNAMEIVSKGRTTFIIAHRLSTIKNADQIIVIDAGKLQGVGTHQELLKTSKKYQEMYEGQFN